MNVLLQEIFKQYPVKFPLSLSTPPFDYPYDMKSAQHGASPLSV